MAAGRLAGKVAVVTGAASGIGAATAKRFAEEGAKVVVADMQDERGRAVADEIGRQAFFHHVDVSSEDQVRAMIAAARDQWGRIDVLFNNAGFGGALGPIESTSLEEYDITFDVLLKGVFLGIKHAAPVMKKQGAGSIINTASVAALRSGFSPHLYAVAKAAVVKLTETVSLELGQHSIRVNCICPGFIATPLAAGHPDAGEEGLARVRSDFAALQPIGRTGEGADIANAALYLACDESSFVTGQAIVVDGGISAGPPWERWPKWMAEARPIKMYRPKGR